MCYIQAHQQFPMVMTMAKTAYLNTRIEPELKSEAEGIFRKIGISTSDAISIFLRQVVAHRGFPFPVLEPNEETIEALEEDWRAMRGYRSGREMMRDILDESD